jgi:Peptidase S24-like
MNPDDPRTVATVGLLRAYRTAGTTAWVEARGISMRPLVPPGSRLLVEFGARAPRVGDVILFERRGGVVAHRIVGQRRRGDVIEIVAKGDAEAHTDPPVAPSAVLGVVRAVVQPDGRSVDVGLTGRRAALIAHVSRWSARAGRAGRTIARRTPAALRPAVETGATSLSRVPTRFITASMPRPDRDRSTERR